MQEAIQIVNDWIAKNDPTLELNLSHLYLEKLPTIPPTCQILSCRCNKLTSLPQLPNCQILYCEINKLINLPELPNCKILYCHDNKLTTLPKLPNCKVLYCENNKLTILPDLSNCYLLVCTDNQLTVLPQLPSYIDGSVILCQSNNKYLHINKLQANRFILSQTPNYNKYATIIQRNYKNCLRKKYHDIISQYLFKGPTSLVCLFAV